MDGDDARELVSAVRRSTSETDPSRGGIEVAFRRALDVTFDVDGRPDPGLSMPFEGGAVCVATEGKKRIFDRESGLVLTVFPEQASFENEVRGRHTFGKYVPIPPVVETDAARRLVVEEFIEPPARPVSVGMADLESVMLEYVEGYVGYLCDWKDPSEGGSLPTVTTRDLVARAPAVVDQRLESALSDLLFGVEIEVPLARAHGDLWSDNVVWGDDGWYVVDWDAPGPRVFFCDAVSWFFIEAVRGRTELLDRYLDGRYDERFEELFRTLGLKFADHPREAYLALYLLDRVTRSAELEPGGWVPGMESPLALLDRLRRRIDRHQSGTGPLEDSS